MSTRVFVDGCTLADSAGDTPLQLDDHPPQQSGIPVEEPSAAPSHPPNRRLVRSASSIVRRSYDVVLPPWAFYTCWWLAQLYHITSAAFTGVAGMAHLFLGKDTVYDNVWLLAIPKNTLLVSGWSYIIVAFMHVFAVVASVVLSVLGGRLTFGYDADFDRVLSLQALSKQPHDRKRSQVALLLSSATTSPIRWWHSYLDHLLSVRGNLFDATFHAKQLFEVVMQTYQAFTLSRSVPNRRINRLVVAMIVLNCLYTPVVDHLFRKRSGVRRLVNLGFDLVVDFAIAVFVPIWIVMPVFGQFDSSLGRFPDELTYNDVWVAHTVADTRQALVTSTMDYMSSLLPHVLGIFTIDSIKSIVRLRSHQYELSTRHSESEATQSRVASVDKQQPAALTRAKSGGVRPSKSSIRPPKRRRTHLVMEAAQKSARARFSTVVSSVIDRIMMLWVTLVLVFHFRTESRLDQTLQGCDLRVNAWLPNGFPCSVFRVNCYYLGNQGDSDAMTQQLQQLDMTVLTKVVFTHCEALEMPPIITRFSMLRAIETFNSTLVEWNNSAAVTFTTTPMLAQVQMVFTNFSTSRPGLPAGIFHEQTPLGLNVIVHRSNLSTLQPSIGHVWGQHHWGTLWFEYAQLTELPESLRELRISKISLRGNQIEVLDDALFRINSPSMVQLSDNPLRQLPSEFKDSTGLQALFAERTNVSDLPSWAVEWVRAMSTNRDLCLEGSAFCGKNAADNDDDDEQLIATACVPADRSRHREAVRVDLLMPQRPL